MTRVVGGGAGGRVRNACARRGQTSKCASSKLNRRVRAKGRSSASPTHLPGTLNWGGGGGGGGGGGKGRSRNKVAIIRNEQVV